MRFPFVAAAAFAVLLWAPGVLAAEAPAPAESAAPGDGLTEEQRIIFADGRKKRALNEKTGFQSWKFGSALPKRKMAVEAQTPEGPVYRAGSSRIGAVGVNVSLAYGNGKLGTIYLTASGARDAEQLKQTLIEAFGWPKEGTVDSDSLKWDTIHVGLVYRYDRVLGKGAAMFYSKDVANEASEKREGEARKGVGDLE